MRLCAASRLISGTPVTCNRIPTENRFSHDSDDVRVYNIDSGAPVFGPLTGLPSQYYLERVAIVTMAAGSFLDAGHWYHTRKQDS